MNAGIVLLQKDEVLFNSCGLILVARFQSVHASFEWGCIAWRINT